MPEPAAAGFGTCANCGTPLVGPHCHACGQQRADRRLNLGDLAHEAFDEVFGVDGRLWRTIRELSLRPGDAIRAWVHGRRKLLVGPVRYYLGCVLLYVVIVQFTGLPGFDASLVPASDSDLSDALLGYFEFFSKNVKLITVAFMPIMALLFHRAFRSQGYDLAETFAFTLFANGHLSLIGTIAPLSLLVSRDVRVTSAASLLVLLLAVGYLSWAARRFFGDGLAWTILKVIAVYFAWSTFLGLTMGAMLGTSILLSR